MSEPGAIDWKKVRDERVPPVAADDPVLELVRAQLAWVTANPAPEGNDPVTGMSYTELRENFRRYLLDEIERYRWRKAGFEPTREMLDACREGDKL
jgi:hypothetical protein